MYDPKLSFRQQPAVIALFTRLDITEINNPLTPPDSDDTNSPAEAAREAMLSALMASLKGRPADFDDGTSWSGEWRRVVAEAITSRGSWTADNESGT